MAKRKRTPSGNYKNIKWTKANAEALFDELLDWMRADPKNIVWDRFTVIEKQLYPEIVSYLVRRYPSLEEKLSMAKKIQEIRLIEGGLTKDLDKAVSIFLLKTKYGYIDTSRVINDVTVNPDSIPLFPDSDKPENDKK